MESILQPLDSARPVLNHMAISFSRSQDRATARTSRKTVACPVTRWSLFPFPADITDSSQANLHSALQATVSLGLLHLTIWRPRVTLSACFSALRGSQFVFGQRTYQRAPCKLTEDANTLNPALADEGLDWQGSTPRPGCLGTTRIVSKKKTSDSFSSISAGKSNWPGQVSAAGSSNSVAFHPLR